MPRKVGSSTTKRTSRRILKQSSNKETAAPSTTRSKIPTRSIKKAKRVFKKFSLSKFVNNKRPANYVSPGQDVADAQRQLVNESIARLNNVNVPPRTLTISFRANQIQTLLPSLNLKAGTIDLPDVMTALQKNLRGSEFYATGNVTLNRLSLQAQVQEIVSSVIQKAKK